MSKHRESISREEFEQIERYLLDGMDGAERAAFERQMSIDHTLRHEVALQAKLLSAVESGSFKMHEINQQANKTSQIRIPLIDYWRYAAAAVVVVGLGLAGWWFSGQASTSHSDLYHAYFRPDLGLPVVMGTDSTKYLFNEGMVSYKEGHYEEAIAIWETLMAKKGITDTLDYYVGVSHMNMENHVKASEYLTSISENEQSVFRDRAIWYRALLKLKRKEYEETKRLLRQLPEKMEAAELLEKMGD